GGGARRARTRAPPRARVGGRAHRGGCDGGARGLLGLARPRDRPRARSGPSARRCMTQALLVSNVVLWVTVVVLACVVAALARQIGVLYERVAPAGALMVGKGPAVGEPAPVVRALDLAGTVRDLGGPGAGGRSTLLFFLSPTCPICKALLPVLRSIARREGDWLGIVLASDGARDEHERSEEHTSELQS